MSVLGLGPPVLLLPGMEQRFLLWKQQTLSRLDLSKKNSLDPHVQHLVPLINSWPQYCSTSSCSGRIILIDGDSQSSEVQKQNCVWLFVSHDRCSADQLVSGLSGSVGDAVLKFEPFVLHVQCRRLEDAQLLHSVAVGSGFRNSGITVGKTGKIMAAVRSTHGLEVPLSLRGKLLVGREYMDFLVQVANQKMEENLRRIQRFQQNLQTALSSQEPEAPGSQQLQHDVQETEERKQSDVYRRRRRRERHRTDCCHGDGDDGVTELDDCLDLLLGNGSE